MEGPGTEPQPDHYATLGLAPKEEDKPKINKAYYKLGEQRLPPSGFFFLFF